jgi:ABC-type multidrug transport system fused ATPase/permease subunit
MEPHNPDPQFPGSHPPPVRVFRRLLGLLRPYRGSIALGVVLLLLAVPCELFPALTWLYITDDIIVPNLPGNLQPPGGAGNRTPVLSWMMSLGGTLQGWKPLLASALIFLFVVYAIGEALGTLSTWVMNRVAQRFILELRNRVYRKLQCQSLAYLQRQRTGDLMSRATGDVDELQGFVVNGIDVIVSESVLWVATVVLVMLMDWRVAGASLAPLLVVYLLLRVFNAWVKPIYGAARERAGDVSNRLQENLSGITVIKIFSREPQEERRFRETTEAYYRQQIRAVNARSLYFPFSRAVGFFSNVNMIGLGAFSILTGGGFTLGRLVAFRAYWWRLFGPIQTLARVNDMVQRAVAAARRVFEVLDAPDELPDAPDARPLEHVKGQLELGDVSFAYPSGPRVLHDVSISIEPGQTVALCGPSGSGKSTILNLLLRFYDPARGTVTLDGRDLRSITRDSLRGHFALVQQDSFLFNDSVLDNIRYGHPEATMEQVTAAAQAANAHEFITRLPSGYDTIVGERGVRLSGGQRQRISIARAFLADPQILLLDEPTSSVEPESESAIIAALDRLMAGRTTVLTSHRPSLINQADVVYVIEDGRVSAAGSPAELRERGGWFKRFVRTTEEVVG